MKACPFCAEEILDAAILCKHCGRDLRAPSEITLAPTANTPQVVIMKPAWNPGVAALLSLIIPGAGQMYKGNVTGGLLWLFSVVIGYFLFILPGFLLHLLCIMNAASGQASQQGPSPKQ